MRYGSGLAISEPFILLDTGRKKTVMVSVLEYGAIKARAKPGFEVLLWDKHYPKRRPKGKVSGLALIAASLLKEKGIKAVQMPMNALAIQVETLRKRGVAVELGEVYQERAIKRAEEMREIEKAWKATVAAMKKVMKIIKESRVEKSNELTWKNKKLTSELLRTEARKTLLDHSCEAQELIISHGARSAVPHDNGSGALHAHEAIVLDFFPRSMDSGYWFDMTRTVCKGEPSPELQRQFDAVLASQKAALAKVRAGASCATLFKAAAQELARRGYKTKGEEGFTHSLGHGVGLEIHEAPSLSPRSKERLRSGMIIAVEPGLYYGSTGGVRIEDTVLVTAKGFNDLTRMEKVLRL